MFKKIFLFLLTSMLFLSAACQKAPLKITDTDNESADTCSSFDAFMDDWFMANVKGDTLTLHYTLSSPESYGIDDYNVSVGSFSSLNYELYYNELESLKDELNSFTYSALDGPRRLTYDVFSDYIDSALMSKDLFYFKTFLGPVTGVEAQYPVIFAEYTFASERDITDYLTLLSQLDGLFNDILQFEDEKALKGFGLSDHLIDSAINICNTYTADINNSFLITTFNNRIDNCSFLSNDQKELYKKKNLEIITGDFLSAYRHLADGLLNLKGRGKNDSGLCWYEGGCEYYDYLVRSNVCSSFNTDELLPQIVKQVNSQILQLSTLLTVDSEIIDEWNNFSFMLSSPDEILNDLKNKTSADFPQISDTEYSVKEVDKSMESILSPAFYLTPPIDAISDNTIYVNYGSPNISDSTLYTTLAHEGYPGHLYQTIYYLDHCSTPARTLLNFKGYTEGWATYAEYLSYSYAESKNLRMNEAKMLNSAIILGVYAMLDININYNYYTVEDTKQLIQKYFADISEETARNIYYAIIEEPSNYLSYYGGYLEISLLQNEAREALGENFSLQEFHRFLLDMGECSFKVIRNYFPEWIKEQQSR